VEKIVAFFKEGKKQSHIAKELDISYGAVQKVLLKVGLKQRKQKIY
jgi:DNA-binding NarL/FixJ family response regulator